MKLIGAILLYCVCLPLLARCAIETDKFSRIELSVLSPLNNSIVGSFVEVRFQLDFFNEANLRVNPPFTEYVLEIVENNDFAHASIMPNFSPWVSIAYGPIGGEGTRQLDFKMTVNSKHPDALPREYVLRASVTVNAAAKGYLQMSQLSNAELENDNQILNDLLTSLISYHKPLATTVALALDNRNIAYQSVVKVSPQIMEFFDWSAFTADCASSPELNFGPLFTSWQNVHKGSELQYRAYYDVSLVSFTTSIRGLDTTQLNAMTRFLYSMKIRTSGHFVLVTTSLLLQSLQTSAESLFGSAAFLTENIEQQMSYSDRVVLIFYRSVQNRVLASSVRYDDFLGHSTSAEVTAGGAAVVGRASDIDHQRMITTSGVYQEIENGVNYIILHKACIQSEGKLVVLTTEGYDGPVVDQLNLTDLNEFMDRAGFMPFTRVRQGVAYGDERVLLVNASAALVIPFYHNNVFHHFQSLAGLLSLKDVFPEELEFLLMPRYDSTADNQYEWSNGVLSLVTQYYERQTSVYEGMSVLFQQQFKDLFASSRSDLVCFKELVIVGQVDTNRGFFTNSDALHKFREVAYDTYARDDKKSCPTTVAGAASAAPVGASTLSTPLTADVISRQRTDKSEPQFNKISKYLIRVTFSLRLHNRRILNLAALHNALVDSGVVDLDWLNHLQRQLQVVGEGKQRQLGRDGEVLFNVHSGWTYLDNMSLQDQIKIFKQTDLFIGVHGSAFINAALFMQPHSVCIALMQSRHIEFVLPQIIHQAGIMFHFLPILDQNQSTNCLSPFSPDCVAGSLTRAGRMDCLPIRNCDVSVDVDWFLALVELSAYHIRANKRRDSWIV